MRGYVINLDRQPERLTHFYQQPGSEIFQKVSAVDRKVLLAPFLTLNVGN